MGCFRAADLGDRHDRSIDHRTTVGARGVAFDHCESLPARPLAPRGALSRWIHGGTGHGAAGRIVFDPTIHPARRPIVSGARTHTRLPAPDAGTRRRAPMVRRASLAFASLLLPFLLAADSPGYRFHRAVEGA